MSHANDFYVGQRVKMTARALEQGLQGNAKTPFGTVRRIHPDAVFSIVVQRDGLRGTSSYHCDFWEPDNG